MDGRLIVHTINVLRSRARSWRLQTPQDGNAQ
jgi:hypothetical protein